MQYYNLRSGGRRADNIAGFAVSLRTSWLCKSNLVLCNTCHVFAIGHSI